MHAPATLVTNRRGEAPHDPLRSSLARFVRILSLAAAAAIVSSCADPDRVNENIYEGMRTREQIRANPTEQRPAEKAPPDYQGYEAERRKLLKQEPDAQR